MEDAGFGRDNQRVGVKLGGGADQLAGGADHIGQRDDLGRGFRVHQHLGLRLLAHQAAQGARLKLLVHDAGALPQQHIGPALALHIVAQKLIRRPQNLLALRVQMLRHRQGDRRGNHPVRPRLDRRAGVGVDHHLAVRMGVAEGGERIRRAGQVERAFGVVVNHQHPLVRAENLGRLAHKAHPGHDHRLRRVFKAETRHFERIGDEAPALLGQVLQGIVHIVMRDQHRVFRLQLLNQARLQGGRACGVQRRVRGGPGLLRPLHDLVSGGAACGGGVWHNRNSFTDTLIMRPPHAFDKPAAAEGG